MTRFVRTAVLFASAVFALSAAGCGKSPTAPDPLATEPPPAQVKTPVGVIVSSISVTKFPSKTTDGKDWDISLFTADKRPDLYVSLAVPNSIPDYTSNTVTNAEFGKVYTFTKAASVYDGSLPDYDTSHRIYLMDADVGGDPDRLGWITVNVPAAYNGDNASAFDHTYTDSGNRVSIRVRGTWKY